MLDEDANVLRLAGSAANDRDLSRQGRRLYRRAVSGTSGHPGDVTTAAGWPRRPPAVSLVNDLAGVRHGLDWASRSSLVPSIVSPRQQPARVLRRPGPVAVGAGQGPVVDLDTLRVDAQRVARPNIGRLFTTLSMIAGFEADLARARTRKGMAVARAMITKTPRIVQLLS